MTYDPEILDYAGDKVIDLLEVPHHHRRDVFYRSVQKGFYHMPPFILHLPCTSEGDREMSIRIPLRHMAFSRYHMRILVANTDLSVTVGRAHHLGTEHYRLARKWHKDRFNERNSAFSDGTLNTYLNEISHPSDQAVEFRDPLGRLLGACLLGRNRDVDGQDIAHAFYFYYDTDRMDRRLGYAMLLIIMDSLRKSGCDHFFPGIYQPTGPYAYKANLSPIVEKWSQGGWTPLGHAQRPRPSAPCGLRLTLRHRLAL